MISIKDLVSKEIYSCASDLISSLSQENKLSEEYLHLFSSVDYSEIEDTILDYDCVIKIDNDGYHGIYSNTDKEFIIDPYTTDKIEILREFLDYQDLDISDYEDEINEHWIISSWLAKKLEAYGECIEYNFYGLIIWGRATTGQAIYCDDVIKQIYADLINSK